MKADGFRCALCVFVVFFVLQTTFPVYLFHEAPVYRIAANRLHQ